MKINSAFFWRCLPFLSDFFLELFFLHPCSVLSPLRTDICQIIPRMNLPHIRLLYFILNAFNICKMKYVNFIKEYMLFMFMFKAILHLSCLLHFLRLSSCLLKDTVKWWTKWRWSDFLGLTLFEFTNLPFSQQEHLQTFSTSLAKWNMCASLRFRVREILKIHFRLSAWRRELFGPGPWYNFIISILLKKSWYPYVRVSLKRDEYHIYTVQLSLWSL